MVDGLSLAFIVFNAPGCAEFVIETPTAITEDGLIRVHHYSQLRGLPVKNTLYAHDWPQLGAQRRRKRATSESFLDSVST